MNKMVAALTGMVVLSSFAFGGNARADDMEQFLNCNKLVVDAGVSIILVKELIGTYTQATITEGSIFASVASRETFANVQSQRNAETLVYSADGFEGHSFKLTVDLSKEINGKYDAVLDFGNEQQDITCQFNAVAL
jgi:hypothetical protein